MNDRIVAFIDLLAMSNNVREDINGAIGMFSAYNTILSTKMMDIYHPSSYSGALKDVAKSHSIDSFEYFIPFSDSIFVVSQDANSFVMQLSSFIYSSFHFTHQFYLHPKNPSKPTKGDMLSVEQNSDGRFQTITKEVDYYPALFRGGISYGEVIPLELFSIINNEKTKRESLTGKAVVSAAKLEGIEKGPRILFRQDVVGLLNKDICARYIRKINGSDLFELLWPTAMYIPDNGMMDFQHFYTIFYAAANLWKGNKGTPNEIHYIAFMELIVASTLQYFNLIGHREETMAKIVKAIETQGLSDRISDLIVV